MLENHNFFLFPTKPCVSLAVHVTWQEMYTKEASLYFLIQWEGACDSTPEAIVDVKELQTGVWDFFQLWNTIYIYETLRFVFIYQFVTAGKYFLEEALAMYSELK